MDGRNVATCASAPSKGLEPRCRVELVNDLPLEVDEREVDG